MLLYCRYLRNINKYRAEGQQIVYTDETWINQNHVRHGGWTENQATSMTAISPSCTECSRYIPSGKGPRLIVLDAGSSNTGFIPGAGTSVCFEDEERRLSRRDECNVSFSLFLHILKFNCGLITIPHFCSFLDL